MLWKNNSKLRFDLLLMILSQTVYSATSLQDYVKQMGYYEIFNHDKLMDLYHTIIDICSHSFITNICKNGIALVMGEMSQRNFHDEIFFEYELCIGSSGASFRQFLHYAQLMTSGKCTKMQLTSLFFFFTEKLFFPQKERFQKFDHGPKINLKKYGNINPPSYNFSNIRTRLHIIYGTHDALVLREVRLFECLFNKMKILSAFRIFPSC